MDVNKLKQYGAIKREIKMLERQIERLHSKSGYVADTVVSGSEFPYKKHTVVISGYAYDEENINELRRLKERKKALSHEFDDIDTFVNDISDSTIRQIIRLKYLEGKTWRKVGYEMKYSKSGIYNKYIRFIKSGDKKDK